MKNNQLPHAAVLKHMADHGFGSVEYEEIDVWYAAGSNLTPITHPGLNWRIKPVITPLHIDDFPMPETEAPAFNTRYYLLLDNQSYRWNGGSDDTRFLNSGCLYLDNDKRDKASKLLIAALTRKGSGECS